MSRRSKSVKHLICPSRLNNFLVDLMGLVPIAFAPRFAPLILGSAEHSTQDLVVVVCLDEIPESRGIRDLGSNLVWSWKYLAIPRRRPAIAGGAKPIDRVVSLWVSGLRTDGNEEKRCKQSEH